MNDEQYLKHCRAALGHFADELAIRAEHLPPADPLRELAGAFKALLDDADALYSEGPPLVTRLFTTYPDFAPTFPRELLWFFGGECLHFMPDDEIELHRQLEELRAAAAAAGEKLDLRAARSKLLKLQ
jgi:hypothetical protein